MTRDYAHYKKKQQRPKGKGLGLLFALLFCGLAVGLAFYAHNKGLTLAAVKEAAAQKATAYFPHLHQHKQARVPAKKVAANTAASVKPIHFDFYDELPKAHLELPEEQGPAEEAVEEPNTTLAVAQKAEAAAQPAEGATPTLAGSETMKQEEVTQELASDLSSMKAAETSATPYILQVSLFHNLDAAKRYRAALASAGLKVDLVKLRLGKEVVYRLQQGPYTNLDQLKQAKKRLTERGVACDIRKLSPYLM